MTRRMGGCILFIVMWQLACLPQAAIAFEAEYLYSFGEFGSGPGQLSRPQGLDVTPDGRVVVADSDNDRLQVFDLEGDFLEQIGTTGSGPGELRTPIGVSVLGNARIYVSESNNHRVQVFDADGNSEFIFGSFGTGPGQFDNPNSLYVDEIDGRVYVAERDNDRVQVFSIDGTQRLFEVGRTDPGLMHAPGDIQSFDDGMFFVSDNFFDDILVFGQDGEFLYRFGGRGSDPGQFNSPSFIEAFADYMLISDGGNNRVQILDQRGHFQYAFGDSGPVSEQLSKPSGIAFGPNGLLYVAEFRNNRVSVWRVVPEPGLSLAFCLLVVVLLRNSVSRTYR